jgi:hypothetical protein
MIQVSIKKQEQITNQASFQSMEEAQAWLSHHEGMKSFGQPKQIIQQQIELSPPVLDEEGIELSPAVTEMKEVELAGEYEVEIIDISAEFAQEKINAEAQAFLDSTDWMVIRAMEKGEELSPEFKAERQAARDSIVKG